MKLSEFGRTGLKLPRIIFGTSCLGNLYEALPWETKLGILREIFTRVPAPAVLDSAGKYGAGLALEMIGRGLRELGIAPENAVISNKLGWLRVPLSGPEPTFERGVWAELKHDAEQHFSYDGIMKCWQQGCELLGGKYRPQLVSAHDPDEYIAMAKTDGERRQCWANILESYRALADLKKRGDARGVGVGSKDWRVIRELSEKVDLDWVMFACSFTIYNHPPELLAFIESLRRRGVGIVNSAVFNAGFLTGGKFFDYRIPDPNNPADKKLFEWREQFLALCRQHDVSPSVACVEFGLSAPGIAAVALNTSKPARVADNVAFVETTAPRVFWTAMKDAGLIARDYPHLG